MVLTVYNGRNKLKFQYGEFVQENNLKAEFSPKWYWIKHIFEKYIQK
jgi:hypothetical protein